VGRAEGALMHFLAQVFHWFTTGSHWQGIDGIPHRLWEHVSMSIGASVLGAAIALPLGIGLGHIGRGGLLAANFTNVGRAIPSFGLLVIMLQLFGIGAVPTFVVLVALAIPPMVTNSYAGMRGVDRDLVGAARGMGMTGGQTLWRVELPLAMPLVMAGVRTAAVQVVATASLGALVAWGGLGRYIIDGIAAQDNVKVFAGALLVALLSLLTEIVLAAVQRIVTPRPLRVGQDSAKNETFAGLAEAVDPA
jgi:osmoprotectant transport system permease protein